MKLDDILEIADKRTKGKWKGTYFADAEEGYVESRLKKNKINNLNEFHNWHPDEVCEVLSIACIETEGDTHFMGIAPEMESKLRAMKELLPEITQLLIWCVETPAEDDMHKILTKLEEWEND